MFYSRWPSADLAFLNDQGTAEWGFMGMMVALGLIRTKEEQEDVFLPILILLELKNNT